MPANQTTPAVACMMLRHGSSQGRPNKFSTTQPRTDSRMKSTAANGARPARRPIQPERATRDALNGRGDSQIDRYVQPIALANAADSRKAPPLGRRTIAVSQMSMVAPSVSKVPVASHVRSRPSCLMTPFTSSRYRRSITTKRGERGAPMHCRWPLDSSCRIVRECRSRGRRLNSRTRITVSSTNTVRPDRRRTRVRTAGTTGRETSTTTPALPTRQTGCRAQ